ncbi:hypothetical protein ACFWVU_02355 [Streptomyces sp. NPDC058686]
MPLQVADSPDGRGLGFHAHPICRAAGKSYDPAIGPKGWAALHRLAYAQ